MERQAVPISYSLEAAELVKVTLIRPRFKSIWESLALGYIASYVNRYYTEHMLELAFFDGYFDSDKTIIEGSVNSDFVAFSCTSPQMKHALALAKAIKEENPLVRTVFGGHHPSSLPDETLELPNVDAVVQGEGETGMLDLLTRNRPIEGLWHGRIIDDLDTIPFPYRVLIRQDRTLALTEKNDGERIASVLSGRVCPYQCIFCTGDRDVFGNTVRKRSVFQVLNEMEYLVSEWKVEFIKFADAELNSKLSWLQEFCHEKIKRKKMSFGCNIHVANMDLPTMKLMKEADCREIWVGVESGSPKILREMRKGITVKQVENVFRWAKVAGIRTRAYFLTGFPSETREDFEMTLDLAERLDADVYGMTVICPYPGTQLYSEKFKDVDWSETDEYGNDFWRTEHFSSEQLKSMQTEFTEKFKDRLCWRQKGELK